jgi:glycosyltransferase involved in cell wall biosynthesis
LREAIESVLAQQGVSTEVIVVDDDDEGSGEAVVRAVGDHRVRYLRCRPVSGGNPAIVRNLGWPEANGRYVHFLDDDDVVCPGAHREMVAALDNTPSAGVVFGVIEPFGDDPAILQKERLYFARAAHRARVAHRFGSRRLRAAYMLFRETILVNSACMIRRGYIGSLGGYRPEVLVVEDVDFYARAIRRFDSVFLDRPVLRYRCGAPSIMSGQKNNRVIASSYAKMYAAYRREHGRLEFAVLQLLARLVLRGLVLAMVTVPATIADVPLGDLSLTF